MSRCRFTTFRTPNIRNLALIDQLVGQRFGNSGEAELLRDLVYQNTIIGEW